jgi:hypothetical protein
LHPFKNNALIQEKMKKVSLVFASLAMVAFVACNNAEEAPVTEEVIEVVEEAPVVEETMVEEVADTTMEATEEAM